MATFGFPDEEDQEGGDFGEAGGVEGDERTDHGRSYNTGCASLPNYNSF